MLRTLEQMKAGTEAMRRFLLEAMAARQRGPQDAPSALKALAPKALAPKPAKPKPRRRRPRR